MNSLHLHLLVVHIPVVGGLYVTFLYALGLALRSEMLQRIALALFLFGLLAAGVAYFSGQAAYEQLNERRAVPADLVEEHALWGRVGFISSIVVGMVALNVLLRFWQGEPAVPWLCWILLTGMVILCIVYAWTAYRGGLIGHPEILH